jgi:agmatinase
MLFVNLGSVELSTRIHSGNESFFGLEKSASNNDLVVLGVAWDATSSYRKGAAAGPNAIRRATDWRLYNQFTEKGADLATLWRVCDHGDVRGSPRVVNASMLERAVGAAVNQHGHSKPSLLFLGGDHFITYPCFSSVATMHKRPLSLLYFDAHPDLYEQYEGYPNSHATVVSRILERKDLSSGLVCYVGIRASTAWQEDRIKAFGLIEFTTHDVQSQGCETVGATLKSLLKNQPVYISIDLDCLDPAFAPGVGNPQPGGLSTRQLIEILHALEGLEVIAADIVEYCPRLDSKGTTTAFTAAILVKEIMGVMGKSPS